MNQKYVIGIDRGATITRLAIGNKNGFLAEPVSLPTPDKLEVLAELVKEEIKKQGFKANQIKGIGIGAAGIVNPEEKEIVLAANVPAISFKPLEKELGIPVELENDCNVAVMGEKIYGDGRDVENLVYITISTGIGAGVYYQGRLLKSLKTGRAAEVGFFVIDSEGKCETFGKKGVWEAYCSGRNIPNFVRMLLKKEKRETKLKEIKEIKAEDLFRLTRGGDEVARDYFEEICRFNAIGFANVINAYNPELITVGGSVVVKNPEIIKGIKRYVGNYTVNLLPEIRITRLGENIGLYGALALIF